VSSAPAKINRLIIGSLLCGVAWVVLDGHFSFLFGADANGLLYI
jgi:hypothetical protein